MSASAEGFDRAGGKVRGVPAALQWTLLAALAGMFMLLSLGSASRKSVTVDELGHLPSGLYTLVTGDSRHATLNPPLLNALSALPVLSLELERDFAPPRASEDVFTFWDSGYHFMERHRADYLRIYDVARWVPVLLVVGLGVLLFIWAGQLAPECQPWAGLLAAALLWSSPNVIAHARLVGTDTGTALFVALSLFVFRSMLLRPTVVRALWFGVVLGLAQLSKFYALLLYPLCIVLVFVWHASSDGERPARGRLLGACLAAFGLSILVLNAGYAFSESGQALATFTLRSELLTRLQNGSLGALPLPVPAAFVRALDGQLFEVASGIRSFLLGHSFQGGRWDYYLILVAIKTPLLFFVTFGVALCGLFLRPGWPRRELAVLLAYPALLFLALSFSGGRQLGARALLSAVPLVQLWVAVSWVRFWPVPRRMLATAGAIVIAIGTAAWAFPDYLSYFNSVAGGNAAGYRLASDSNIDIGQDLEGLARYLDELDAGEVQLFYFGSVDPALYGIDYRVPAEYRLEAGYLAISVSLYHMSYDVYDHGRLRRVGPVDVSSLGRPVASIGDSIHVYRLIAPAG